MFSTEYKPDRFKLCVLAVGSMRRNEKSTYVWRDEVRFQKEVGIYKDILDEEGGVSDGNFERTIYQVSRSRCIMCNFLNPIMSYFFSGVTSICACVCTT